MTILLKQSTAVVISFGPFVDKTDGNSWETGLVSALDHGTTGIMLAKNGGTLAVRAATVTATTYDAYGCYKVTLSTTDTGTLGTLKIMYGDNNTTALPVWLECMVVPANVWDSWFGADLLQVDITQLLGTAWATPNTAGLPDVNMRQISTDAAAADNAELFFDGTGYAGTNNVIPAVTTLTNAPLDSSGTTTLLSRLSAARAGYIDNLSAGAAALEASVQSVLSKLLKYFQLALRKDSAIATDNATEVTAINANGGSGAGAFANTTDAQEAIRDNMGTAQTGDAYAIVNSGTFGNSALKTLIDAIDDYVDSEIAAVKSKTDLLNFTGTDLKATLDGETVALTANQLALKKNAAFANFMFKMVLASDHLTAATGKTITAQRAIDAGSFASCANAATEVASGWYRISLAAADLNGDSIALHFTEATCDACDILIITQA